VTNRRKGFTLIETLIAISMFAILSLALTPLLVYQKRRERLATAATYRWALSAQSINRVNAIPAAALLAGTSCDTAEALPIQFTRCVTVANVSERLQRVTVVVLPLNQSWIPGDTLVLERANNVGALDVLGGP
jgi:prepilin-type N-terminal cleavage/methylation domain-containing protein